MIKYIIYKNILLILSTFLLFALFVGKVDIITSILIYCMWFTFGFVSFQRGYEQRIDEEMAKYYRQKVEEEYNKTNEISNN
jgi:Ca2+/Na+ antiporter|tara:strand:- start:1759 stop:2001 length:243 start_codon:yes stop_codon:yes gene_type:complete